MTQGTMIDRNMQLVDWLDDLCVRFIINLPHEELESVARICFQVEEAQWFYEDFIRPIDPTLPSLHLKDFCLAIFRHCPLLSSFSSSQHLAAYQEFLGYKTRVPVRGAILLNHDMDQVLLVKGWKKSASWSFPRGKINKDEKDLDCAIREVYEETGYDINAAGLYEDPDEVKAIDVSMREQHIRLFVFRSVPQTTEFAPRTRKEISKIDWYKLNDLPTFRKGRGAEDSSAQMQVNANKFYMVAPFLGPLKKWIKQQHKLDAQQAKYGDLGEITEDGFATGSLQDSLPETYTQQAPIRSIENDTLQLKQLLNIGASMPPLAAQSMPGTFNDLQLPGSSTLPVHTPFEQIRAVPPEPQSPHPQRPALHLREMHPNFGATPPHQHQKLQQAIQTPFEAGMHGMHSSQATSGYFGNFGHGNGSAPGQQLQPQHHQIAPEASKLPVPNMSNHTMNLLNAFKTQPAPVAPLAPVSAPQDVHNTHQASLLDLFRRPSMPKSEHNPPQAHYQPSSRDGLPQASHAASAPDQVTPSEPTSRPIEQRRKSSAYSMYTRTLPKQKSTPPIPPVPQINSIEVFPTVTPSQPAVVKAAAQSARVKSQQGPKLQPSQSQSPQFTILQRPASATSKPAVLGTVPAKSPPKSTTSDKKQEARAQPVMHILSRPASRTGNGTTSARTAKASMAPSKAVAQSQQQPFQPQVLKRPDTVAPAEQTSDTGAERNAAEDKRNALLAMFSSDNAKSKPAVADSASSRQSPMDNSSQNAATSRKMAHGLRDLQIAAPIHEQPQHFGTTTQNSAASALLGALSAQRASASNSPFNVASPTSVSGRSVVNPTGVSRKFSEGTRSPESPAEAKDFLLGFLKGVK